MRKTRVILSIDGGGVRGILPLIILNELDKKLHQELGIPGVNDLFDMYAGTSTGAIISAALMLKENGKSIYKPEDILNLYQAKGPKIFNVSRPEQSNLSSLQLVLDNNFGNFDLKDLNAYFAFVSWDNDKKAPFVFSNQMDQLRDISLAKALMACSAIPPYFNPVEIGHYKLSDGIMANKNPAEIALNYAKSFFNDELIVLISFGTGKLPEVLHDDIEKNAIKTHKELTKLSNNNQDFIYHRVEPFLDKASTAMDDASAENIKHLIHDGMSFLKQTKQIDKILHDLKQNLTKFS